MATTMGLDAVSQSAGTPNVSTASEEAGSKYLNVTYMKSTTAMDQHHGARRNHSMISTIHPLRADAVSELKIETTSLLKSVTDHLLDAHLGRSDTMKKRKSTVLKKALTEELDA